jgi:hypothetical protein
LLTGCNALLGNDGWTLADGGSADGTAVFGDSSNNDTSTFVGDARGADSAAPPSDAMTGDSSPLQPDTAAQDSGSSLSSSLVLPPPSGSPCDPSQGDGDCPMGETCRISSTTFGRCDTYATSGGIAGFPCTVDSDCNDTLQCWMGVCKVLCELGNSCIGGCECFSVGNDTTGLCCPGTQ